MKTRTSSSVEMLFSFITCLKIINMDLGLKDKVIIVSGGAKGIGEGIVKVLAAEGAIPAVIGRSKQDNDKVVQDVLALGGQAFAVEAELSQPGECEKAI